MTRARRGKDPARGMVPLTKGQALDWLCSMERVEIESKAAELAAKVNGIVYDALEEYRRSIRAVSRAAGKRRGK